MKNVYYVYKRYQFDIHEVYGMNISYDYYRVFYYVAKCGGISQAAKKLFGNQPNITRTIKKLESQLGCPLFMRTGRGMKLTAEGETLYSHVRIAVEHIETAENELAQSANLENGTVFVAASEVALRCLLLPVLKEFRHLYPGIHIRISNHSTPQAIAELKEGTADFAVVTTPTVHAGTLTEKSVKLIRETAICSPKFSALTGKKISLAELKEVPLISLGSDTMSYEFFSEFFKNHGELYQPDIEAFTADQILPIVEAGLGIGFVPQEFVHESDNVAIIDLAEEIPMRSICLIKRTEQPLSAAARELEKMILNYLN